jgi:hypothetical protein
VLLAPNLNASSSTVHEITRTSSDTNTALVPLAIKHKTSGDMIDGFSSRIFFTIEDNANVNNFISGIGGARSGADNSGRLTFLTNNAGTLTEKMTIMPDGKVGIGTSSPATQLDILSSTFAGIKVKRSSGGASVILHENSAGNQYYSGIDTSGNYYILNGSFTTTMLATSGGLVGINETSPTAQLQVKSGATTRVPLIVDTLASQTANLQQWRVNGSNQAFIDEFGTYFGNGISNVASTSNARVSTATTGTTISRNIADTNPALIVNLQNASATGNIQVWQKAGVAQAWMNGIGGLTLKDQLLVDNVGSGEPIQVNDSLGVVFNVLDNGDVENANGTYSTFSDIRLKENIVQARDYTDDLMKLNVVKYSLKKDNKKEPTHLGFIAQEVEKVFPGLVSTKKTKELDDQKSIKISVLIPMLVKTIQELNKRIDDLENKK